jgi:PAS domain S-box-containing protein
MQRSADANMTVNRPVPASSGVSDDPHLALGIFNAWVTPICVLDDRGTIIATNAAWRETAVTRGGLLDRTCEGVSYLGVCEQYARAVEHDPATLSFMLNLRAVLAGDLERFEVQYPSDSPTERRWYDGRVRTFEVEGTRRIAVIHIDITALKRSELRAASQARITSMLARRGSLPEILAEIVSSLEQENPAVRSSIMLLDDSGQRLMHGAAPSLPAAYVRAVHGASIGPNAGSCGTAAYTGERVIVTDIETDPRWADYREAALAAGLRACWSEPIRDAAGQLLGTFGMYPNTAHAPSDDDIATITNAARFAAIAITRKRDEAALYESEARFTQAFEHSSVGVGFIDENGALFKVNRAMCEILGYSAEELQGHTYGSLTHVDDRERSDAYVTRLRRGEIESFQHEQRYLHKSGRTVWAILSVSMVRGERGQPMYAVAQVLDVSAMHLAEDERNLIFDYSLDLLCVADIDGAFKQLNPAWSRVLGWDRAELLGRPYLELVHPEDLVATLNAGERLRNGQPVIEFENRYRCKNGSYRLLSWNSFPLPDAGVTLAVVRDVTARHAAEHERRGIEERLRESQKMESLGALAGGIAHDFNNILAVILGNVGLAERALERGAPLGDKLKQIEIAGQRAVDLVQQIMAFSRRQPQQLRVLSLAEVVRETMMLLRATIPAGIAIDTRIDEAVPSVLADATQMHQVLMNLCTNAWHALREIPTRHGRISVSLALHDGRDGPPPGLRGETGPGPLVCLSVADNGIGMDGATVARMFEPFFTTRAPGDGTGLGLSVVHGIIAAHHGAIAVDSLPGSGTTFRIYLPVSGESVDAPTHAKPGATPGPSPSRRVLYIDDEAQLVTLAGELLADDGIEVMGHVDAEAALTALRADPQGFDLVVSDFNMPKMSGLDVARAAHDIRAALPVVLASGYITPELQSEAASCGVRHLLHKPDIAGRLRAVVHEVLNAGA